MRNKESVKTRDTKTGAADIKERLSCPAAGPNPTAICALKPKSKAPRPIRQSDGTRIDLLRNAGGADAQAIIFCVDGNGLDKAQLQPILEAFPKAAIMVRAYDRLLVAGHYIIPLYYIGAQWVARWKYIDRPDMTPIQGNQKQTWWDARAQ